MKRLAIRLMASYVVAALLVLVAAGLTAGRLLDRYLYNLDQATGQTRLDEAARVAAVILAKVPEADRAEIQAVLSQAFVGVHVTDDNPGGTPPTVMPRGYLTSEAISRTGLQVIRVMSVPDTERVRIITVEENASLRSAFRVTLESPVTVRTSAITSALLWAGSTGLITAIALALWISRPVIAPLNRMALAAERLSDGEWDTPLPSDGPTEIQRLADAFRAMAEKLRVEFGRLRTDRKKLQQLIAEMAHELKTPIASLGAYHELLLDDGLKDAETRRELLERGSTQVKRLEHLTQSMLTMARLEADSSALDLLEADLGVVVRDAVAGVAPVVEDQGVAVEVLLPPEPVVALVDPQRLRQALDNLLQNALRFSPPDGTIRVTLERSNGKATIAVSDTGPGIPQELLPRLFDPFVRGPGSPGAGLGLAIVRAVVEGHGGSVTAENLPTGGARFSMTLPA